MKNALYITAGLAVIFSIFLYGSSDQTADLPNNRIVNKSERNSAAVLHELAAVEATSLRTPESAGAGEHQMQRIVEDTGSEIIAAMPDTALMIRNNHGLPLRDVRVRTPTGAVWKPLYDGEEESVSIPSLPVGSQISAVGFQPQSVVEGRDVVTLNPSTLLVVEFPEGSFLPEIPPTANADGLGRNFKSPWGVLSVDNDRLALAARVDRTLSSAVAGDEVSVNCRLPNGRRISLAWSPYQERFVTLRLPAIHCEAPPSHTLTLRAKDKGHGPVNSWKLLSRSATAPTSAADVYQVPGLTMLVRKWNPVPRLLLESADEAIFENVDSNLAYSASAVTSNDTALGVINVQPGQEIANIDLCAIPKVRVHLETPDGSSASFRETRWRTRFGTSSEWNSSGHSLANEVGDFSFQPLRLPPEDLLFDGSIPSHGEVELRVEGFESQTIPMRYDRFSTPASSITVSLQHKPSHLTVSASQSISDSGATLIFGSGGSCRTLGLELWDGVGGLYQAHVKNLDGTGYTQTSLSEDLASTANAMLKLSTGRLIPLEWVQGSLVEMPSIRSHYTVDYSDAILNSGPIFLGYEWAGVDVLLGRIRPEMDKIWSFDTPLDSINFWWRSGRDVFVGKHSSKVTPDSLNHIYIDK